MRTRLALLAVPLALVSVVATSATAAPKAKPFSEKYTASAPVPGAGLACSGTTPMGQDLHEVKIPAAGKVTVDLKGFLGDWDLHVLFNGAEVGVSEEIQPLADGEAVVVKLKKAGKLVINACNYNGGPSASVELKYAP